MNGGPGTNHSSDPKGVWQENSDHINMRVRRRNVIQSKKLDGNPNF